MTLPSTGYYPEPQVNEEQRRRLAEAKVALVQAGELVKVAARAIANGAAASEFMVNDDFHRVGREMRSLAAWCDVTAEVGKLGDQIAKYGERIQTDEGDDY